MASKSIGIPVYTACQLQNHAGSEQYLTLDQLKFWHGFGDPPKAIQDQQAGDFHHTADAKGSIGGIAYVLKDKLKWIIAWSNAEKENNKVYTEIVPIKDTIDWNKIKNSLDGSGNESSDTKFGYSSKTNIDKESDTPKMTAKLTLAS